MKRLYAVLIAAALCFPSIGALAWWQSIQQHAALIRACTDDTASTNFLARTSGLTNADKDVLCTLIEFYEANGIITGNLSGAAGCGSVLQGLYFTVSTSTANANLNLCGTSFTLSSSSPPAFTVYGGYQGDGTSTFLDTGFNPATAGVAVTSSSNSIGLYLGNVRAANGSETDIGCANPANTIYSYMNALSDSTGINAELNSFTFPASFSTPATPAGYSSLTRTSTTLSAYKNNSSTALSPSPEADTALALPSCNYFLLAFNGPTAGVASSFAPDTLYATVYGAGITGAQHVIIANGINTALTAYGLNKF